MFTEFATGALPYSMVVGPDQRIWFPEQSSQIGAITTSGQLTQYATNTPSANPTGITVGPDSALWFTETDAKKIGRITTSGVMTEFPIADSSGFPTGIVTGPDGNLWFAEMHYTGSQSAIGVMSPAGTLLHDYALPSSPNNSDPRSIIVGPDGNLWFTEQQTGKIGRITTAGTITQFTTPSETSPPSYCQYSEDYPYYITNGPDGAMWFTEAFCGQIGRITTSGTFHEYVLPNHSSTPVGITTGPDGDLWFTEVDPSSNAIGRMTTAGQLVEEDRVPTAASGPYGIVTGPDHNIWFTETSTGKVGRLTIPAATTPSSPSIPVPATGSNQPSSALSLLLLLFGAVGIAVAKVGRKHQNIGKL